MIGAIFIYMITVDTDRKEIRVSDDTSLDELANFLQDSLGEYKVVIYGTDENSNT